MSTTCCGRPFVPVGVAGYQTTTRRPSARSSVVYPAAYGPGFAYGDATFGVLGVRRAAPLEPPELQAANETSTTMQASDVGNHGRRTRNEVTLRSMSGD